MVDALVLLLAVAILMFAAFPGSTKPRKNLYESGKEGVDWCAKGFPIGTGTGEFSCLSIKDAVEGGLLKKQTEECRPELNKRGRGSAIKSLIFFQRKTTNDTLISIGMAPESNKYILLSASRRKKGKYRQFSLLSSGFEDPNQFQKTDSGDTSFYTLIPSNFRYIKLSEVSCNGRKSAALLLPVEKSNLAVLKSIEKRRRNKLFGGASLRESSAHKNNSFRFIEDSDLNIYLLTGNNLFSYQGYSSIEDFKERREAATASKNKKITRRRVLRRSLRTAATPKPCKNGICPSTGACKSKFVKCPSGSSGTCEDPCTPCTQYCFSGGTCQRSGNVYCDLGGASRYCIESATCIALRAGG